MTEESGAKYARKLELLLERFPHPDGRPWRGSEIEDESAGLISQQYFSALRRGRFRKPGYEQLKAIANVMGFPLELWDAEPEQWPRILDQHGAGTSTAVSSYTRSRATSLSQTLSAIRQSVHNPKTSRPFTDEEIADRSGHRLSAEDVRALSAGEFKDPTYDQILALSDVFGVAADYWHTGSYRASPVLDTHLLDILADQQSHTLLRRWGQLSPSHRTMLLNIAREFATFEHTNNHSDDQELTSRSTA